MSHAPVSKHVVKCEFNFYMNKLSKLFNCACKQENNNYFDFVWYLKILSFCVFINGRTWKNMHGVTLTLKLLQKIATPNPCRNQKRSHTLFLSKPHIKKKSLLCTFVSEQLSRVSEQLSRYSIWDRDIPLQNIL